MLSCFVTLVVSAALGQVPDEAAWLKAIPADVDVAVRVRPLTKGRDDLVAMIQAMSPTLAAQAEPALGQGLQLFSGKYGDEAAGQPFVFVIKAPKPGEMPGWAVLVKSKNYTGTLGHVAHKDDVKPKSLAGYDSFETDEGVTYFSIKGDGFVGFGPDEALIKGMVKPSASLATKLGDEVKNEIFAGDVGLYVNVAGLQAQFGDQIEGARAQAMGALEAQAGGQVGAEAIKLLAGAIFDAVKTGDALAVHLDFAAEGLTVGGVATSKAEAGSPKKSSSVKPASGDMLGRFPADATTYAFLNVDPAAAAGLQKFGMSFLTPAGKTSPEMEKALALQRESAGSQTYTSNTTGAGGTRSLTITEPADPKKAVEAATAVSKASASPDGIVKDVAVQPDAEKYKGYTLNRAKITFNLEKMAAPNMPGGVETVRKMLGGDTATTWYGTDGKKFLSVAAKDWAEAKAQIDAMVDGKDTLSASANYKAVRDKLPKQATVLMLMSAQGIVKQVAGQFGAMTGNEMKVPADVPKETTFLGGAVVATPTGYSFTFVLPSNNGPVLEKGIAPLIQGMRGQVNQ